MRHNSNTWKQFAQRISYCPWHYLLSVLHSSWRFRFSFS